MTNVFTKLIESPYMKTLSSPFRIMLYNGDLSLKAMIMETEYFAETLASNLKANVTSSRAQWLYTQPGLNSESRTAGYAKSFNFNSQNVNLDLVTIKGAGTFVATDRPGPALQLFSNFITGTGDYSNSISFSLERNPLKKQYLPQPPAPLTVMTTSSSSNNPTPSSDNPNPTTTDGVMSYKDVLTLPLLILMISGYLLF